MSEQLTSPRQGAPRGALFVLVALAAIAGSAGVALAAVAAHRVDSPGLATAAMMLMVHGAAVVGFCGIAGLGVKPMLWVAVAAALWIGAIMFSGAIALSTLAGVAIPMLAPAGGMIMIGSWLAAAGAAVLSCRNL